jgi:hypothetical protein
MSCQYLMLFTETAILNVPPIPRASKAAAALVNDGGYDYFKS